MRLVGCRLIVNLLGVSLSPLGDHVVLGPHFVHEVRLQGCISLYAEHIAPPCERSVLASQFRACFKLGHPHCESAFTRTI